MMTYLHRIAEQLNAMAQEMEQATSRSTFERLWVAHFRQDAKSIRLLAEAREGEVPV